MTLQQDQWQTNPPLNHFYSNKILSNEQKEIWESVEQYLKPWLQERTQLIQSWHKVLEISLSNSNVEKEVQKLCEILMDYISAGHFEIYEKLLEESKAFNDGFLSIAEPLYELIGHSTEQAICFNEKYETGKRCRLKRKQLPFELSKLGEALEERFKAEDQLVKFLHQLHNNYALA
jgi:regulator of sigma D